MLTWFRKKMKTIMIVVAVVFAGSMFYGLGYQGLKGGESGSSKVLAKVNGREIDPMRYQELVNRVAQNFGTNLSPSDMAMVDNLALGQTIDFTLMKQAAEKKVKVSGAEIDAALNSVMQQQKIPSKKELENALKRIGLSLGQFRDFIKGDILVQKLQTKMQEEIRVTPDDLREVRASHILITTEAEAKNILQELRQGADFAALAKKYSRDPGSAAKGGDLGYFSAGNMVEAFEKAAFALKPGETSGIIKTPFGYHILKVTDSRLRKFPGVADKDIEAAALREKQEKTFRRWYSEVRSQAKVEIVNPVLKGHDLRYKGQTAAAVEEYKKAIVQNPVNPYIHIYLGDTYMSMGRRDLALAEYENAVKVEGGNPDLYIVLGRVYEGIGERTLAADQYRKASLIAGDNKDFHAKLLKLFQNLKRPAEVAREQSEIRRLEKKERFEKELTGGK
ncbi:MAG: peptidylprolyl isomerase [Candidatus Margulisbacteria bacterium]|nr:peptidylprolyl isomerase [Candidatus Margulisiibacteriota bacterium]